MRPVSATGFIDAPRERIFDLLVDLSLRPAFTDQVFSEFRLARMDPVGPGAAARFRIGDGGRWLETVIEAVERPHLIREHGRTGRLNRIPTFTVWEIAEGASAEGSEVTVTFWTEPTSPVDRVGELFGSARRFRRGWSRALGQLKGLAEGGGQPERVEVAGSELLPAFNR
jgi:uncharacterized protein YndB with AHSA1/START domain